MFGGEAKNPGLNSLLHKNVDLLSRLLRIPWTSFYSGLVVWKILFISPAFLAYVVF
jgi:hypothetical protein